jgi:adenosylcobinamide amidohydrolase
MQLPFTLDSDPPFLLLRFAAVQDTLGWSILRPGFAAAREIVWLEVRDAELPSNRDPAAFLRERLSSHGIGEDALAFMTARDIRRLHLAQASAGRATATCATTVGLTNGERIGARRGERPQNWGTINTLVHVSRPLSIGALVESVSIATQARTVAILEANDMWPAASVTGTGTDCILIAAPHGEDAELYAGLHTEVGEAIGRAVYDATFDGVKTWKS